MKSPETLVSTWGRLSQAPRPGAVDHVAATRMTAHGPRASVASRAVAAHGVAAASGGCMRPSQPMVAVTGAVAEANGSARSPRGRRSLAASAAVGVHVAPRGPVLSPRPLARRLNLGLSLQVVESPDESPSRRAPPPSPTSCERACLRVRGCVSSVRFHSRLVPSPARVAIMSRACSEQQASGAGERRRKRRLERCTRAAPPTPPERYFSGTREVPRADREQHLDGAGVEGCAPWR